MKWKAGLALGILVVLAAAAFLIGRSKPSGAETRTEALAAPPDGSGAEPAADAADENPLLDLPAPEPLLGEIADAAGFMPEAVFGPGLTEEWIEFERLSGDMLFPSVPMRMEAAIWRAYRMVATNAEADPAALGFKMLSSTSAFVRTTGAIWMLEQNGQLNPAILDQLIGDEEAFVPLTVLGWMRDSGLEQVAEQFAARWRAAGNEAETAAIEALLDASLNNMAGRTALWLSEKSARSEDEKRELAARVLADEAADYGVRGQAALLLRNRMEVAAYQELIAGHAEVPPPVSLEAPEPEDGEAPEWEPPTAFEAAMGLLNQRTAGPAEVMGRTPVLTKDDADLFFAEESAVMLENAALWVEAVVDYGTAEARPGFADTLARYVADLPVEELPANQALTLRRIQSRLAALKRMEREGAPEE